MIDAAIDFREEHELHGETIARELLSRHGIAPTVTNEVCRQIRVHDSPSCHAYEQMRPGIARTETSRFLFAADDPIWTLRQSDRSFMLSIYEIKFALIAKKLEPTQEALAKKIRSNLSTHWREACLYDGFADGFFFGKTLCRSLAAYRLYEQLLDEVEAEFGVNLTEVKSEFELNNASGGREESNEQFKSAV